MNTSDDTQDAPIRVEDLWFPDHGLVIQAGKRLFRVSGGMLAARSPVFRDMLSIPQPDSQPLMDGCPLVALHDSPIDAEYFLRAVFDSSFFERPPAPTTFAIVAGVLKLSTKYDVEYLQHRALLHVSAALPRTLAEYDARMPGSPFGARNSEFPLLLLVHELGLAWALPMAMYFACCVPVKAILDGAPFSPAPSSPSSQNQTQPRPQSQYESQPPPQTTHLPPALQRTLLIARSTLAVSQTHAILRCLRSLPSSACASPAHCQTKSRAAHDAFTEIKGVNPLDVMNPAVWRTLQPLLCAACFDAAREEHRGARERVWEELPGVFGLEGWDGGSGSGAPKDW